MAVTPPVLTPPTAGPRNLREMFYYVWTNLRGVVTQTNEHIISIDNPHDTYHSQTLGQTPNDHHNQVHLLYGSDHSDVDTTDGLLNRDLLAWNGVAFMPDKRMNWITGGYVGGVDYLKHDVIVDSGYLAIVKVPSTQERPAPQPVGNSFWTLDDTDVGWSDETFLGNNVTAGNDFINNTVPFELQAVRIYIPFAQADVYYRAAFGHATTDDLEDFVIDYSEWYDSVSTGTGWVEIEADGTIFPAGSHITVAIESENRAAAQVDDVFYDYTSSNGDVVIGAGDMHRRNNRDYVDISKTPQSGTLVVDPIAGTTIDSALSAWNVIAVADNGTYWRCTISGTGDPLPGNVEFTFTTPTAQVSQYYLENPGYWTANPLPNADASGVLIKDGVETTSDAAYGADIKIQQITISDDWDLLASPGGGTAGGGGDFTPNIYTGIGNASGYVPDTATSVDQVLYASGDWGTVYHNIEGGSANTVYLVEQIIDGGGA